MAADYLRQHGWEILERNFTFGRNEVDIIARKGDDICFIEVKFRHGTEYGEPEEFVTRNKVSRIKSAAKYYMGTHDTGNCAIILGVIAITDDRLTFTKGFFQW